MGGNAVSWIIAAGMAILCLSGTPASAADGDKAGDRPRVVFLQSGETDSDAWTRQLTQIGNTAAEDLDIEFEVLYSRPGRKEIFDTIADYIEGETPPDYMLLVNYRSGVEYVLKFLEEKQVKSFLINADLSESGKELVGEPREKLHYWIGRLIPDDELAGYDLAQYLFEQARQDHPGETITALGITGSYASTAASKRMEGLQQAAAEADDVDLKQVVTARWSGNTAQLKYQLLKNRYGDFDVVWVANDGMAMGVVAALKPGEEVEIGGMDWTSEALTEMENRAMSASMGGHMLDIGYALALIRLYHDGCDFAEETKETSLSSRLSLMTQDTEEYHDLIRTQDWDRLDFSLIDCAFAKSGGLERMSIDKFYRLSAMKAN